MKKQLIPVEDKVIIKPFSKEEQTTGGLFLPEISQEAVDMGTVVSIGPGQKNLNTGVRMEMKANIGDVVLYPKYGGNKFDYEEEEFVVFREVDLIAFIK